MEAGAQRDPEARLAGEPWRRTQDVLLGRLLVQGSYLGRPVVAAALEEAARRLQAGQPSSLARIILETGQIQASVVDGVMAEVARSWAICAACGAANPRQANGQPSPDCQQCKAALMEPGISEADASAVTVMISDGNPGLIGMPPAAATGVAAPGSNPQVSVAPQASQPSSGSGFLVSPHVSHVLQATPGSGLVMAPAGSTGSLNAIPREGTEAAASGDGVAFDKYVIQSELGRGGMGIVYKAWHPTLRRTYALKVLLAGEDASSEAITRFQNEAAAVARMGKHPHIVSIHETGQVGNRCFFTLDFVDGPSLEALVQERSGNLPVRQAAEIMSKVARAVHHAHLNGVIHRDLKPQNILINSQGEPNVTDFGLAKDVGGESGITRTGVAMGSPPYMSPEQASGRQKEVGERSDVYSLGATLYYALTGRAAFSGPSMLGIITKVMTQDPVSPRKHRLTIPAEVEAICLRAMEKAPERRYPTAQAFAEDLTRWLKGKVVEARPPTRIEMIRRWMRRHTVSVGVVAVALLVCLGAIAWTVRENRVSSQQLEEVRELNQRRQKAVDLVAQARRLGVTASDEEGRLEILDEALKLVPTSLEALSERALAYQRTGQIDEAVADLQELTRLSPDDLEAQFELGELLAVHKGRLEPVRRMALALRDQDRTSPLGPLLEVLVCLEEGDERQARSSLAMAATNDGESWWQYHLMAGRLALLPGPSHDARVAEAAFKRALIRRKTPSAQLYALRALAREELANVSGALSDCEAALELSSANALALAVRGFLRTTENDKERGLEDVEKALELDPTGLEMLYHRGLVHLLHEETGPALDYFESALAQSSKDARVLFALGQVHEQDGDLQLAIEYVEEAVALSPTMIVWKSVLERMQRRRDQVVGAREIPGTRPSSGQRLVGITQLDAESKALNLRAESLVSAKRFSEALAVLNELLEREPGFSMGYLQRARALDNLGRRDESLRELGICVQMDPSLAEQALCYSGQVRTRQADYRGALADFERLVLQFPHHDDGLFLLALAKDRMGDTRGAIAALDQTLIRTPGDHGFLETRGQFHLKLRQADEAVRDLLEARRTHMGCTTSCRLLGQAQLIKGDRDAALKTLSDLCELDASARGWLAQAPEFSELRGDPRFQKILEGR